MKNLFLLQQMRAILHRTCCIIAIRGLPAICGRPSSRGWMPIYPAVVKGLTTYLTPVLVCIYVPRPFPPSEESDHIPAVVTVAPRDLLDLKPRLVRVRTHASRALQLPGGRVSTNPMGPTTSFLLSIYIYIP